MLKKTLLLAIFSAFMFCSSAFGEELNLVKGKAYLLVFDDEIENIHHNPDCLNVQIIHTIFNDRKQMIISLKSNCRSFLQVKTSNDFLNYEIINAKVPSKQLIEIDTPPFENLDVDIYAGQEG